MNVTAAKNKIMDGRIREIIQKIDHNQVEDDEWEGLLKEMWAYVDRDDTPADVKRLFYPLGYIEVASMIIDGIVRWKNSACVKCQNQQGFGKYSCSVYQKDEGHRGGIPNEIWANEDMRCQHYKAKGQMQG